MFSSSTLVIANKIKEHILLDKGEELEESGLRI